MVLLPDITIDNIVLSIQDPFTINGDLIKEMYYTSASLYGNICFKTVNGNHFGINYDRLLNTFNRTMRYFISTHHNDFFVGDENWCPLGGWTSFSAHDYFTLIKEQCDTINEDIMGNRLNLSYLSYGSRTIIPGGYNCDVMTDRLRRQGRLQMISTNDEGNEAMCTSTTTTQLDGELWSEQRAQMQNVPPENIGLESSITREDIDDLFTYDGFPVGRSSQNSCNSVKKYIHSYNYKPEYIKYYMEDEDESTLLLGAEIEVDCGGESENHAREVLKIITNNKVDIENDNIEKKMYCTHDGSLSDGIEFDTMPMTLRYHKERMYYEKMFDYLDRHGYKAHDTATCGLHIHACRAYLGKTEFVQQLVITKILYILEKFNDEVCVIARRNNNYSRFIGKGKDEKEFIDLYKKYKDSNKHVALNLQHKDTIEFRCFKGTLKYETFILTLEFVQNIIDFAKNISIEDIELMKWEDLFNTFSHDLKKYYEHRKNIEKEKKEKNCAEQELGASIHLSSGRITINNQIEDLSSYLGTIPSTVDALATLETRVAESTVGNSYSFGGWSVSNALEFTYTSSLSSSSTPVAYGNRGITVELADDADERETKISELKQKVKDIKLRLKNCRSYLVKKQLSKELCDCQKQITLLKRQITR